MLTVPNVQTVTNGTTGFDISTVRDSVDTKASALGDAGQAYVVSGCAVTFVSGRKYNIAAGVIAVKGLLVTVASQTVTIAAVTTYDRRDIIVVSSAGTASIVKGTQCGKATWTRSTTTNLPPVKPALTTTKVLLAEIAVPHGTGGSTLHSYNIVDKRCFEVAGNYYTHYITTTVTLTANTKKTVVTTGTLGIGTWGVACTIVTKASSATVEAKGTTLSIGVGSASATFLGPTSSEQYKTATATLYVGTGFTTIVKITTAGTLIMSAYANGVASVAEVHDANTEGYCTGIVAWRIG